jgi:16S rRNA (adenine1518-N6/adenine1519-N6)-dimethyltransferase
VHNISRDVSNLPPLRDIIRDHDLRAEKKLGQNFLLDLNLTDKIARAAGNLSGTTVFEIGPGPGGLTRSLVQSDAHHVIAIEYDPRAIKALEGLNIAARERLDIRHGDALDVDLCTLSQSPRAIVANLPYNIATPLLINWLRQIHSDINAYRSMTLMFQKEVAQRIAAQVGDKAYGRLAVLSQWLCDAHLVFDVPASAFTPPPKVTSSIIYLQPKKREDTSPSFKAIEKLTAEAFGQRRKMIRSSLKNYKQYFEELGLDETLRAENLSVEQFIALAKIAEKDGLL